MPGPPYKTPGLIRAGFQYQDLVAIEVLLDFYRAPDRFAWVALDAPEPAVRAIDDVVACLPDGRYDLTQVKFTGDPGKPANALSWAWLTEVEGRGRSLLQKWAHTTAALAASGGLAAARLKTNRRPDAEFAAVLEDGFVAWDRLSPPRQAELAAQIGSAAAAEAFFAAFEFRHSLPHIEDLEEQLYARISADTDSGGWQLFRRQVERWSTRRNDPHPDGRIRLVHLRQAFAPERPRPLPQDFRVPAGYRPPDSHFDDDFQDRVLGGDGVTVLWGPPGRGKSTYLSHLAEQLQRRPALVVRHHYFLGLDDRSEGRFHFHAISHSLQAQLQDALPDSERKTRPLAGAIAEAAKQLAGQGRRLVVVVDGLDHVWREHRDAEEMEELFSALLPPPPNVSLVVGTQKIDPGHLPSALMAALPPDRWTELPLMSQASVAHWVALQDAAGRLNLDAEPDRHAAVLGDVVEALHDISQGLPLHLIYSFETLARLGTPVGAADVRALPACPTGDIRDYYRGFWTRARPKARAILHTLAGLAFGPPPNAVHDCFGRSDEALSALAEIAHLLEHREIGIAPFHGSLFAFAREEPEHAALFQAHAPDVLAWLRSDRAGYWGWAWRWITEAQLGNPRPLLEGATRTWALDGLARGYPLEQITEILSHAEVAALNAFDLPRLLKIRGLKVRTLNGPEFQTNAWPDLCAVTLALSEDPTAPALRRGDRARTPGGLFAYLVRSASPADRDRVRGEAIDELNRRLQARRGDRVLYTDHYQRLAQEMVAAAGSAGHGADDTRNLLRFVGGRGGDELLAIYARAARLAGRPDKVLDLCRHRRGSDLGRELLAVLAQEGLDPSKVQALKGRDYPAIAALAAAHGTPVRRLRVTRDAARLWPELRGAPLSFDEGMGSYLYALFFALLSDALAGKDPTGSVKIPPPVADTWLARLVAALEAFAADVGESWRATAVWPSPFELYARLDFATPSSRSHNDHRRVAAARLAVRDIVLDLAQLRLALDPAGLIGPEEFAGASGAALWLDQIWIQAAAERRLRVHAPDAMAWLLDKQSAWLDANITEFIERTDLSTQLATLALDHGLLDMARRERDRALKCLLGYGWRKDPFAFEVLDALELLASHGRPEAKARLLALANAFEAITDYTDGDETNHARSQYYEAIGRHFPERAGACYAQLTAEDEWRYAYAVLEGVVKAVDLETPAGEALLRTLLPMGETALLEDLASKAGPRAARALAEVQAATGRTAPAMGRGPRRYESPPLQDKETPPTPGDYPPDRFGAYVAELRRRNIYVDRERHFRAWLAHWDAAGQAAEALASVADAMAGRRGSAPDEILDPAFELALKAQGRTAAWPFIVQAHVARHGWQRYWGESGEARLQTAARVYRDRWRDFIVETARAPDLLSGGGPGMAIGQARLVRFLLSVGEDELAWRCGEALADDFEQELDGQPLPIRTWAR